jgi:hypothetical protein
LHCGEHKMGSFSFVSVRMEDKHKIRSMLIGENERGPGTKRSYCLMGAASSLAALSKKSVRLCVLACMHGFQVARAT